METQLLDKSNNDGKHFLGVGSYYALNDITSKLNITLNREICSF